jgi:hypothetical protein
LKYCGPDSPLVDPGLAIGKHIYRPDRLVEEKGCITVTGRVILKDPKPDGDIHYRLKLDNNQGTGLLNDRNTEKEAGALVFEPICITKPTQPDAIEQGYHQKINCRIKAITCE